MVKAFFLDRDGVIIKDTHYLHKIQEVEILPGVVEAIKGLNENDYKVIVITNQSVVARGICNEERVYEINSYITELLEKQCAKIDGIYYCPHHPNAGKDPKYTRECDCRKPKPGMIFKAVKDFEITNLEDCFMVGDNVSDIKTGQSAGCKTVLIPNEDYSYERANPDYIFKNIHEAVNNLVFNQK